MTDLTKLKALAERATPGPWSCNRHGAVVGGPILDFTNGSAQQQIAMAVGQAWMQDEELRNNAEFIAAANPQAILGLIQELEENEGVINVWRGRTQRAEAEVERLRKLEARQQEITEHYKKWFKEIVYESFDEWLKDDATHWIGEQDAAFQAWQYLHENKIWLMKERIEEHEQERDRLKAENEVLHKDAERYQVIRQKDRGGVVVRDRTSHLFGESLDAAIDAALEGGGR